MINKDQVFRQAVSAIAVIFVFALVGIIYKVITNKLGVGSTKIGNDGMTLLYVPNGDFTMGSDTGELHEMPVHVVTLDGFWIDQTEVTNKMYSLCVDADVCQKPTDISSFTHPNYYGNFKFEDYPVIYVSWDMAKTYCEWAGRRLPTEAEWEKAAHGTEERTYPWGEALMAGFFANFNSTNDTMIVGSYEDGKSPYGAYDMAGNVWEWVSDWYDSSYFQNSPPSNPLGPDSGDMKVLRGGSWNYDDYEIRTTNRNSAIPTNTYYNIGFRCARSQ